MPENLTMTENILVKVSCNESLVAIRTYSRSHGRRGRFLLDANVLWDALWTDYLHYDSDCGHIAKFYRKEEHIFFDVFWLSYYVGDQVDGFVQHFTLPFLDLSYLMQEGGAQAFLCVPQSPVAKVDTTRASRTLRRVIPDKQKRRALSKAMRDCFRWPGETVYLSSDGEHDFFFTTESGFPKNGGLVLHENSNSPYPKVYYSVHT